MKAGTHSAFGERSHTRAHTAKQGHPLPRPQHCLELSAKFFYSATLLYTYISRFTVNPHYISRGRKSGKVAVTVLSQTTSRRAFQLLPQTAHVCFHSRKRVHTRLSEKNRTQGHTRRNRAHFGLGAITTLGAFRTFTNIPGPGIRTAYFAAFGSWSVVLPKNAESLRNSDALMRVAVPRRRGPAGLRNLFRFCRNCGFHALCSGPFRVCEVRGGITTLDTLCVLPKRWMAACQNDLFAVF